MKYEFMHRHAAQYSLAGLCRALSASRSGYYAWRHRAPSTHQREDLALAAHVLRIHAASREAYGARKVWKTPKQGSERNRGQSALSSSAALAFGELTGSGSLLA